MLAAAITALGRRATRSSRDLSPTLAQEGFGAAAFSRDPRAKAGGGGRTRTYEGVSQRIYSPPPLPLGTLPQNGHASARAVCVFAPADVNIVLSFGIAPAGAHNPSGHGNAAY